MVGLLQPSHLIFILLTLLILSVGRDVGDMLPDREARRNRIWAKALVAALLGNLLYFASSPFLPVAARLTGERVSALPALADIWFCVLMYGALNFIRPSGARPRKRKSEKPGM